MKLWRLSYRRLECLVVIFNKQSRLCKSRENDKLLNWSLNYDVFKICTKPPVTLCRKLQAGLPRIFWSFMQEKCYKCVEVRQRENNFMAFVRVIFFVKNRGVHCLKVWDLLQSLSSYCANSSIVIENPFQRLSCIKNIEVLLSLVIFFN